MSNSINYKIQKYNYKLKHATNKKEASIYQAKLRQYKQQQSGGTLSPDIITTLTNTFNNALGLNEEFQRSDEMINQLTDQFRRTMDRLRKECCDKGKNTAEMRQKIEAMEQDFTKLMKTLGANTKEQINTKITGLITESDQLRDQMRDVTLCPPTGEPVEVAQVVSRQENVRKLIPEETAPQSLLQAQRTASEEQQVPKDKEEMYPELIRPAAPGQGSVQQQQAKSSQEKVRKLSPEQRTLQIAEERMKKGGGQIRGKRRLKY